ncbi:MAG: dTDP-4-dehydrorhamnose reductase [Rugosibacter sp.]
MAADILLFGRNGQVGWELQRSLAPLGKVLALASADCDLCDAEAVARAIREAAPRIIVNAAAYTAVDKAESDAAPAMQINAQAPAVMAAEARRLGARLVHYSTDYVFDGHKATPYVETDAPAPQGVYGRSKHAGELAIAASGADALILRTSWVFGAHGGNFVKTILRLAREKDSLRVVDDQIGSPTPAALVADVTALALARLRQEDMTGVATERAQVFPQLFHLCAANPLSWYRFAVAIVEQAHAIGLAGLKLWPEAIVPISTQEYPLPAPRPANSRLDCRKLEQRFDLHLPGWQPYLERMLAGG